jgi:hypothetical protein
MGGNSNGAKFLKKTRTRSYLIPKTVAKMHCPLLYTASFRGFNCLKKDSICRSFRLFELPGHTKKL